MYIKPKNIKAVMRRAREAYEIGCDTVFSEQKCVDPKDLHFCMGMFDVALFYQDHPFDIERYIAYGVRDLYEATVLIQQRRVNEQEYLYRTHQADVLIDLGGFINRRALAEILPLRMSSVPWDLVGMTDPVRRASVERHISKILDDLAELGQSPSGQKLAGELWERYVPDQIQRPDFLARQSPPHRMVARRLPLQPGPAIPSDKAQLAPGAKRSIRGQRRRPG